LIEAFGDKAGLVAVARHKKSARHRLAILSLLRFALI